MNTNHLGSLFVIFILLNLWGCDLFSTPAGMPSPTSEVSLPPMPSSQQVAALIPSAQTALPDLKAAPHYTIELDLDVQANTFHGLSKVDYINAEDTPLDELNFRLLPNGNKSYGDGWLKVSEVSLDGESSSYELSQDDTVLQINLPKLANPGESIRLDFEFEGLVPKDFGSEANTSSYGIYNYSKGVFVLSGFFPILAVYDHQGWNLDPVSLIGDSVYSDIAFYMVTINAPGDLVLVSTGVQLDRRASGNGVQWHLESGPSRDFFLIASPDFRVTSQSIGETTINSYYFPEDEAAANQALDVASDSLKIFTDKFGAYPYSELDLVEAPLQNAYGVEFPGIFLIRETLYESPEKPEFAITIAHEVAHQWWYNLVGNNVFDEPWLDEALATYSSILYYEFEKGKAYQDGLKEYWEDRYDRLVRDGNDDLVTQSLDYFETEGKSRFYSEVVYTKGALFFQALRQEVGDQAFFDALQYYYATNQYRIATAKDLLNTFEQSSGKELDVFFQEWLYSKQ